MFLKERCIQQILSAVMGLGKSWRVFDMKNLSHFALFIRMELTSLIEILWLS